ncbi:unnamed protein product [Closterium sp. NIES-53]
MHLSPSRFAFSIACLSISPSLHPYETLSDSRSRLPASRSPLPKSISSYTPPVLPFPPSNLLSVNGNGVLAPPSLGQRRRLGRMCRRSSRPFTVEELLDGLCRAAGDLCGVAVDQGARQLELTGLGDGWVIDQEEQFDREVDGAVRRPDK